MAHLTQAELNMMDVIWQQEELASKDLVQICLDKYEWKKSTTYTILKHLIDKGMVQNENATVSYLISKEAFMYDKRKNVLKKYFDNSLPSFVAAFSKEVKLSKEDIAELETIIEEYK